MKTPPILTSESKTQAGCDAPPPTRIRECPPCDIARFSRNNYYTGKLLTERELTAEQRYHIDKLRLHQLGLHGWGVVCGLKVTPHPECPSLYVVVKPGLAIDAAGREILVRSCVECPLPRPPATKPPAEDPCPSEYSAPAPPPPPQSKESADASAGKGGAASDPSSMPASGGYPASSSPCPDVPKPCPTQTELYVRLRYVECETEFTPAPFDECSCNGTEQKPNRIVEGYCIDVLRDKPDDWERVIQSFADCPVDECDDIYKELLCACPDPCWPSYIPLAVICNYIPGEPVTPLMIDNRGVRPLLPSTHRLDQLIRCILANIPAKTTTRIRDFNWTHGQSYHCNEFMRLFVEDHYGPRHFEVAFSRPVIAQCLSTQVYQATVVRHDRGHEGGFIEVVPAHVWAEPDGSKFYLRIDKRFAEHCLRGVTFDLQITLRCDVVLDEWGVPVDGDLLARKEGPSPVVKAPTGNGIPGGSFVSWIRVYA
jgi:hypothetical protein